MINKKNAYTLAETLITIILVGIIATIAMLHFKPSNITNDALQKAGVNLYSQIDFGFKNMLAKYSKNYTMLKLISTSNAQFSIADSGADSKLIAILKKALVAKRNSTISSTYLSKTLKNSSGTSYKSGSTTITGSFFTQRIILKNGAILAIHLNGNCTTSETAIIHPVQTQKTTATNSCGLVFYDVNGEDNPNALGVDQYIVSIGKLGIR